MGALIILPKDQIMDAEDEFDFNQWIEQNHLADTKDFFVKYGMTDIDDISLKSPLFIKLISDLSSAKPALTASVVAAIQTLSSLKQQSPHRIVLIKRTDEMSNEDEKQIKQHEERSKLLEVERDTIASKYNTLKNEFENEKQRSKSLMELNSALKQNVMKIQSEKDELEENIDKFIELQQKQTEEKKEGMSNMEVDKLYSISVNITQETKMSTLASLNEFGHKYSINKLNKHDKKQLIDMIQSLYISNQNYKQNLTENVLGVGSESTFLNIEEIVNKYTTLRTQTHNNLHTQLFDAIMEKKYNDDVKDEVVDKESYHILFHILYLSNQKISQEFEDLYSIIAKIIKIDQQKNANEIVSNVLHPTLQTYYKSLIATIDNNEETDEKGKNNVSNESSDLFNFCRMSNIVYNTLVDKFGDYKEILNCIQINVIKYIEKCLQMIVIIQLNKPKLHLNCLNEFDNNTNEKFDENKYEKSNFDYIAIESDDDDNELESKQTECIKYYYFPGLSIEDNISCKGDKNKQRKQNIQYAIICKTQVIC